MSYQDFPPALLILSPRLTIADEPSASVVGISTIPLADGSVVYCIENKSEYQLDRQDDTSPPDGNNVLQPDTGPGRWFKRLPVAAGAVCPSLVLVTSVASLPAPVAGVITLAAATNYQICGTVNISPNTLVMNDRTTISGESPSVDTLVSAGFAGTAMIAIGAGKNVVIENVALSAPGKAIFDVDLGGTGTMVIIAALLAGSGSLGTIRNFARFSGVAVGVQGNANGWTITGTNGDVLWVATRISLNVGTFTFVTVPEASGVSCRNLVFGMSTMDLPAGQTGFDFPTPAAGFAVSRGAISNVFFGGLGTPLAVGGTKITKATPEWTIQLSPSLVDSTALGGAAYSLTGGAGNTTGALVAGTFVPIPSAPSPFVASLSNERFTASAAGVLTYTGLDALQAHVTLSVSVDMTGPGTANYGAAIFMNGGLVANSEQTNQMTAAGSATSAVTVTVIVTVANGDTIEGHVRNNTNGNPLNVYSAQINAVAA
jgi:hypothetical protein